MADIIGTRKQVDEYIGSRLVIAAYQGSRKYFDAYSDVSGNLPLAFNSRVTANLKNYRLYGTENGAGVETENLYNYQNQDPNNGFVPNTIIRASGAGANSNNFNVSEYVEILPSTSYYLYWWADNTTQAGYRIYDENKGGIDGGTYGANSGRTITTPENAKYIRFSVTKNIEHQSLVGLYMTEPDEPVPFGYQIPLTNTSGEQSDTYPVYIGSTKLGAEEYVDYAEQKVHKRTENDFPYAKAGEYEFSEGITVISDGQGAFSFKCESGFNIPVNAESSKIPLCKLFEIPLSVGQGGACTFYIGNNRNDKLRIVFYDETDTEISAWQGNSVWRTTDTYQMQGTVKSISFRNTYTTSVDPRSSVYTPMFSDNGSLTEYLPYLQPTDPPAPFPAITAYKGENTLSSTETVGEVTVRGRISPLLGTALTQANYDLITTVSTLYYPIYSTANGENIWTVKEVTAQEYADLTAYDTATLYIVKSGNDITAVYVGATECDKLYLGSTEQYVKSGNLWRGSFTGSYRYTSSNLLTIGKTPTSSYFMASDYYFPIEGGSVYHYTATKSGISTLSVIINEYDANGSYIDTVGNQPDQGLTNDDILWTTPSNCAYWAITYRDQISVSTLTPSMVTDVILEKYQA